MVSLEIIEAAKMVCRSALKAGVRQPIIHQVADAIHRVLEERCGGEHEHPDRWIDEGDDVEGGNESGEFRDVSEVFERFHDGSGLVSTRKRLSVSPRTIDEWVCTRKIPHLQISPRFYLYDFEAVLAALRKLYQVDARS